MLFMEPEDFCVIFFCIICFAAVSSSNVSKHTQCATLRHSNMTLKLVKLSYLFTNTFNLWSEDVEFPLCSLFHALNVSFDVLVWASLVTFLNIGQRPETDIKLNIQCIEVINLQNIQQTLWVKLLKQTGDENIL